MFKLKGNPYSYWLLFPGVLLYLVFFIIPALMGVGLSFTNVSNFNISEIHFMGWMNYHNILSDTYLSIAIKNSIIFALVTTLLKVTLGMVLAILLNQKLKTKNYLRTIYFLPAVLSSVAVGVFFTSAMHPTTGIINKILNGIGLHALAQDWLVNPHIVMYSLAFVETWKWTGFTMVIILAGLQSISKEYYESAAMDGASSFQKFKSVTFPLVLPYFNNALIVNLIGGLKVFDLVQSMTQGGPGSATEVFGTLVFKSFGNGRFGEGVAASILLSIIVAIIAVPTWKLMARREVEV